MLEDLVNDSPIGVRAQLEPGSGGGYREGQSPPTARVRVRWLDRFDWSDAWVPLLLLAFGAFGVYGTTQPRGYGLGVFIIVLMGLPGLAMFWSLLRTLFNRTHVVIGVERIETRTGPLPPWSRRVFDRNRVRAARNTFERFKNRRSPGSGTVRAIVWLEVDAGDSVELCELPTRSSADYVTKLVNAALAADS